MTMYIVTAFVLRCNFLARSGIEEEERERERGRGREREREGGRERERVRERERGREGGRERERDLCTMYVYCSLYIFHSQLLAIVLCPCPLL